MATKFRHFWLGDKSTGAIIGEAVRATFVAGFLYGFMRLTGQSDAATWCLAFGMGLFLRGLWP